MAWGSPSNRRKLMRWVTRWRFGDGRFMFRDCGGIDEAVTQRADEIVVIGLGAILIMMTGTLWIQILTFVVVLATFVFRVVWPISVRSWWMRRHSPFRLYFRDSATGVTRSTVIPVGDSDHIVSVRISRAVSIDRFDVRFVSTETGGYVNPAVIQIVKVEDAETPTTSMNALVDRDNAKGGRLCLWYPPNRKAAGDRLRLKLSVRATTEWSGFLSFAGDHPCKSRYPVTVISKSK